MGSIRAPSAKLSQSERGLAPVAGSATYSPKPPNRRPSALIFGFSQKMGLPYLQPSHCPQGGEGTQETRSPGRTLLTLRPTSTTSPAYSWPSGPGSNVNAELPVIDTSLPQIPQRCTFMTTSSGPAFGSSADSIRIGMPGPSNRAAFTGPFR